jgi:serine/arginine repetitive matrix protein 1
MSAVSLSSSGDETPKSFPAFVKTPTVQHSAPTSPLLQSNASNAPRKAFHYEELRTSYDRPIPSSSSRVNGTATPSKKKPPSPSFQRSRTYSQPYISDLPDTKPSTSARPKISEDSKSSLETSRSSRPSDVKPTRIPVATRQHSAGSSTHSHPPPVFNGNGHIYGSPEPYQSSDLHVVHETRSNTSSHSNLVAPSPSNLGLLHEQAPFKAGSMSSVPPSLRDDAPSRASNESEERPFEHWYRGEVSRNGGVGELRVGRRQEMLEIANYGYKFRNTALNSHAAENGVDETWRRRKRAGSVSRAEETVRERDSLYLDDEDANEISRVLDEHPPTDLDGDGYSDGASLSEHHYQDLTTASAPLPQSSQEPRSTTPTPSIAQRSSSSRQQNPPPTRIPGPPSRRSSDSRAPTPTSTTMGRGANEPPPVPSTSTTVVSPSKTPSPSPPPSRQRQQSKPTPSSAKKSKSRMAAAKATRAKTAASRKDLEDQSDRRSIAHYPAPADGDELVDAIPSWTQPITKEGNWDEVSCCLPCPTVHAWVAVIDIDLVGCSACCRS